MSEAHENEPEDSGPTDELDPDLDELEEPPEVEPEEPDPETDPEPRRSRSNDTIRSLRTRAQEAERLLNAERENSRRILESRPAPQTIDPQAAVREEAAFRQSLEQMLPHEASLAVAERQERRMQQQIAMAELRGFDRHDAADFQRLCEQRPAIAKKADEVERVLQQRRQGGDYSLGRRQIAAFLIGDEILRRGPAAANAQRRGARDRIARETTRPGSGRGDVARGGSRGGNQDSADEALLRGTRAGDV